MQKIQQQLREVSERLPEYGAAFCYIDERKTKGRSIGGDKVVAVAVPEKLKDGRLGGVRAVPDFADVVQATFTHGTKDLGLQQFQERAAELPQNSQFFKELIGGIGIGLEWFAGANNSIINRLAGTLGIICRDIETGELVILTNRHVWFFEGLDVYQPARQDVIELSRKIGLTVLKVSSNFDAAVIKLTDPRIKLNKGVYGLTERQLIGDGAKAGDLVWKSGRNGITAGKIASRVTVAHPAFPITLNDVLIDGADESGTVNNSDFSRGGDSGSVVLRKSKETDQRPKTITPQQFQTEKIISDHLWGGALIDNIRPVTFASPVSLIMKDLGLIAFDAPFTMPKKMHVVVRPENERGIYSGTIEKQTIKR